MKKFLTVLLVIAVMFTFSFGSAFAAVPSFNKAVATQYFELAMKNIKDAATPAITITDGTDSYVVKYATLNTYKNDILEAILHFEEKGGASGYASSKGDVESILNIRDANGFVYDVAMDLVAAQYAADKANALNILDTLDLSKISTKEMVEEDAEGCTTYLEHIQFVINTAKATITADGITVDSTLANYAAKKVVIDGYFDVYDASAATKYELVAEKGYVGNGGDYVGLGVYELNKGYALYIGGVGVPDTFLSSYTTDVVDAAEVADEASIASYKAAIAQAYATYLQTPNLTAANKAAAANVKKALDFLAEEGEGAALGTLSTYFGNATINADVATAIANVVDFNNYAARLAAQTDETGALVRDAEDVADLVAEGTVNEYADALNVTTADTYRTIGQCEVAITALYDAVADGYLEYLKDRKAAGVENAIEAWEEAETYYPAELAKVKALCEEYLAKVNAITDVDKINFYDSTYTTKIGDVLEASEVDSIPAVGTLQSAAESYLTIVNANLKTANQFYNADNASGVSKLDVLVAELVGNSGVRTAKEITALSEQAIALVKSLPTKAAVEAADEAVEDAVYAIPATVTLADKATIDAAIAAADAYYDLTNADHPDYGDVVTAVTKYAHAYNNALTAKVKAVAATDKAAIKALLAEADAFVEEYDELVAEATLYGIVGDGNTGNYDTLEGYLANIQRAEAAKVRAAIAAIPVLANLTEADKATVEAARAAYDAYVAEYTDPEYNASGVNSNADRETGFVANDFAYNTIFNAEVALGLNDDSAEIAKIEAIASVEGLKITAKSSAKNGSITVKWTVEGDDSNVAYYEVRRSTKKNSGFGTKPYFKATKTSYKNTKGLEAGTRYYYKVRAVAEIDGETYVSDWSNKAYRVAK